MPLSCALQRSNGRESSAGSGPLHVAGLRSAEDIFLSVFPQLPAFTAPPADLLSKVNFVVFFFFLTFLLFTPSSSSSSVTQ